MTVKLMKNTELKKYLRALALILLLVGSCCIVILLVFRSQLLIDGLGRLSAILMPFIYGAAIAYVLRPICCFFERNLTRLSEKIWKKGHPGLIRTCAILLSLLLAAVLITLLIVAVLPQLITSISGIVEQISNVVAEFQTWLRTMDTGETSHEVVRYIEQITLTLTENLQKFLETSLLPNMKTVISEVTSSFLNLVDFIKNFGIGCIVAAYLLGSWEKFMAQARLVVYGLFPKRAADWIRYEVHYTDRMFSGFITGKLLDSAIIGLICFVFTSLVKMPYALLVSIIVGVTNIIPFFGPYLGAVPSALLILIASPYKCIVFLIFIIILQQIDGNILGPSILGDKMGVSGFWVLFSILFFGSVWGLVGMLVGVPVFAVLYDLFRRLVLKGLSLHGQSALLDDYQEQFGEKKEPEKKKDPESSRKFLGRSRTPR